MSTKLTLDMAENLARECGYAHELTQDENAVNWGDAGAFFLEGVMWAQKQKTLGLPAMCPSCLVDNAVYSNYQREYHCLKCDWWQPMEKFGD